MDRLSIQDEVDAKHLQLASIKPFLLQHVVCFLVLSLVNFSTLRDSQLEYEIKEAVH